MKAFTYKSQNFAFDSLPLKKPPAKCRRHTSMYSRSGGGSKPGRCRRQSGRHNDGALHQDRSFSFPSKRKVTTPSGQQKRILFFSSPPRLRKSPPALTDSISGNAFSMVFGKNPWGIRIRRCSCRRFRARCGNQ